MSTKAPPAWHDNILHASVNLGSVELTGVDMAPGSYQRPQGFFVTATSVGAVEAERVFAALAAGGEIRVAFEATYWAPGFGVLVDRFGVPWEINAAEEARPRSEQRATVRRRPFARRRRVHGRCAPHEPAVTGDPDHSCGASRRPGRPNTSRTARERPFTR